MIRQRAARDGEGDVRPRTALRSRFVGAWHAWLRGSTEGVRPDEALRSAYNELEAHVAERTRELRQANLELEHKVKERETAEEALRASEAKFRGLFENVLEGVYQTTPDGRLLTVNPALVRMLGFASEAELLAANIAQDLYVDPTAREFWTRKLECEGRLRNAELVLKRKDGQPLTVLENARAVCDAEGRVLYYEGTLTDITERKQAEEERQRLEERVRHAQKLESLGILAGGIAHDFNNLLVGILGNADLALLDLSPQSPLRENFQGIKKAALRASELTSQMLAYAGRGFFIPKVLDINILARDMQPLLQSSISRKATLRYDLSPTLPLIKGDVAQIRQVVTNLISNASEALGDQGGMITLATGVIAADRAYLAKSYLSDDLAEGRYVFLRISDTGCGMDEETQAKIFDPFFSTKELGRGLGLAAVLGIVHGHRGTLHVQSELGKGTHITILLPCLEQVPQGNLTTER
jgi:PAS domain S-box-containing protein